MADWRAKFGNTILFIEGAAVVGGVIYAWREAHKDSPTKKIESAIHQGMLQVNGRAKERF